MCGIAGFVQTSGQVDLRFIDKQLELLHHRGPDSQGSYRGSDAVVGQTRLAIIDIETGDPPVTNENKTVGVALNGEIYNYRELRTGLVRRGHTFRTRGDTEVIAHLAEELEPIELARALDGMFAFAVWDDKKEVLILARDGLGKKPLYYWFNSSEFVFASEIKALFAHPSVPREMATGAIEAYLRFGYVPTPRTFFEGIYSVPPGHVLVAKKGSEPQLLKYWEPRVPGASDTAHVDESMDVSARTVRKLLSEAVEKRLVADVPVGAFLSGGIDSSSIIALMTECLGEGIQTFTIGFNDEDGYDERRYARLVADRFRTDHVEFVVEPKAVDLVDTLVWHHDQPFGDASAIPTYLLSELTHQHVTVALCGDGGDELFAGYERFAGALMVERLASLPRALRSPLEMALSRVPKGAFGGRGKSARRFARRSRLSPADAFGSWLSYMDDDVLNSLVQESDGWALNDYRAIFERSAQGKLLDRLIDLNLRTYLLDDLLPKVDRMSMAHGLEVRAPFLDRKLLEYSLKLPERLRIRGLAQKRVLKRAMADLLPREILARRKRGFGVPLDRWFRSDLKNYLQGMLMSPDARVREHLRPEAIDRLVTLHDEEKSDEGLALWSLLTLEIFLRKNGW